MRYLKFSYNQLNAKVQFEFPSTNYNKEFLTWQYLWNYWIAGSVVEIEDFAVGLAAFDVETEVYVAAFADFAVETVVFVAEVAA